MWVIKARGETYYVDHVDCEVPWSTKETPDNSHTKGSIKVKQCLVTIYKDNTARISELTAADRERLLGKRSPIRVITSYGKTLREYLRQLEINHAGVLLFGGGCGTAWYVTELNSEEEFTMLTMAVPGLRKLAPNEDYYQDYGDEIVNRSTVPLSTDKGTDDKFFDDEDDWYEN